MAFRTPTFNLTVNIWRFGTLVGNPPDVVTVGNLAFGRRGHTLDGSVTTSGAMFLLVPKLTDIRGKAESPLAAPYDKVEVPAGSGRYYIVDFVDDSGKGFLNEHRVAIIYQANFIALVPNWPLPTP
jgi:hypothetical protein